jgi:rare lipoprotein A
MPHAAPVSPKVLADNQPDGKVTKVPVPASTHLYVQVGAFSKLQNAVTLLSRLGGNLRISTLQRGGQTLYRVRTSPLASIADADAELARITRAGANDAQIVVDQ